MKRRLFKDSDSSWTQEGLDLSNKVESFILGLMKENSDVCQRDMTLICMDAASSAGLELSMERRFEQPPRDCK